MIQSYLQLVFIISITLFSTLSAYGQTYNVNSTNDTSDANLSDGLCADNSGNCTLRAAIEQANANAGQETININVSGTILLNSALDEITTSLVINGNACTIQRNGSFSDCFELDEPASYFEVNNMSINDFNNNGFSSAITTLGCSTLNTLIVSGLTTNNCNDAIVANAIISTSIQDCNLNNDGTNVAIEIAGNSGSTVINNVTIDNFAIGIKLKRGATVSNCNVNNVSQAVFESLTSSSVNTPSNISNNTFNCSSDAVCLEFNNSTISTNTLGVSGGSNNNEAITTSLESSGISMLNNNISSYRSGIFIQGNNHTVEDNTISNCTTNGITNNGSSNITFINNNIQQSNNGIYLNGSNFTLTNNDVIENTNGITIDNCTNTVLNSNIIYCNDNGGIIGIPSTALIPAPVINEVTSSQVTGTAIANTTITLYLHDHSSCSSNTTCQGKEVLGTTTTNSGGNWQVSGLTLQSGDQVTAIANQSGSNSSTFSACSSLESCGSHPDYAPLMALYNSTNGASWTNNSGWADGAAGTNCDPCNGWYGVTCNNNRVELLLLIGNNLVGTIPEELNNLSELLILRLNDNGLFGCAPFFPNPEVWLFDNPLLPWQGYEPCGITAMENQIGAPCNDGDDSNGTSDMIQADCSCGATPIGNDAFITTWNTQNPGSSCNSCVIIPTHPGSMYNYSVDWNNDGFVDQTGITGDVTHDFGAPGTYTIRITGDFPRIYFNNQGDKDKILDVVQWGNMQWGSMERAFRGCSNLNASAIDVPNLSSVTNMEFMFSGANSFNGNLSNWNVSNVTNMEFMFSDASSFNSDLSNWNVSSVTSMDFMFNSASSFNSDLSNWNVSSVTSMDNMFTYAILFNSDLSNWNVSNVTNMDNMFLGTDLFNSDLSNWNVSSVTSMNFMFSDASSFNHSLGTWNLISSLSMTNMLSNSDLSCENYTATLVGWSNNPNTPDDLSLGALNLEYGQGEGEDARNNLINNKGWTISGDVLGSCGQPCTIDLVNGLGLTGCLGEEILITFTTQGVSSISSTGLPNGLSATYNNDMVTIQGNSDIPGAHSFTISTDCGAETNGIIVIHTLPDAPISDGDMSICEGAVNPTLSVSVNGGEIARWYDAESSGILLETGTTYIPTETNPGSYSYWVESNDPITDCVSATRTMLSFTIDPVPQAPISDGDMSICEGAVNPTLSVSVNGGEVARWYDVESSGILLETGITYTPTETNPATYTYWVESIDPITDCVSATRTMISFTIHPIPQAPISNGDVSNCVGDEPTPLSVLLDPGLDARWYDAEVGGALLHTGSEFISTETDAGTYIYWVEAYDPNTNCINPNRIPVSFTFIPLPDIAIISSESDNHICHGESVTLSASNMVDAYMWSTGSTNSEITVTPDITSTYILEVTSNTCSSSVEQEVVVSSVDFTLVASQPVACQDGVEDNNLVVDAIITDGFSPFSFDWNIPSGLDYSIEDGDYPDSRIIIYEEFSDLGTYFIDLNISDSQNCHQEAETEVGIGAQPEIYLTPGDIPCSGVDNTHTISIVSYSPDTEVNMDMIEFYDCSDPAFEALIFSNSFDLEYDFTYNLSVYPCLRIVLTDENGCSNQVVYEPNLSDGIAPILAIGSHCIGDSSEVSVTNASDFSSFLWSTGETTSSIMADDVMNTQYQVTVTDANGCTGATNGEVVVNTIPTVSIAGSTSYCGTSGTTLMADGGDTYQWTDASNTTLSNTAVANINAPGMYTVVVTSTDGCTKDTTVTVAQADNLEITVNEVILCDGGMGTMSAGDNPNYSYSWEQTVNPGVEIGTTFSIEVTSGEYCVTVTDNTEGCTASICETVVINTTPVVEVTEEVTVCNENSGLGETTVDFDAQVINSTGGTWINVNTQAIDLSVNPVDFAGLPLGDYIFQYRSNTAVDPCEDVVDSMVVIVIECACPSVDLLGSETVCNDGTVLDLDDLKNNDNAGTWTPSAGNTLTVSGTSVDFTGVAAGEYFFTWTLDNPVDNCPQSNETSVIVIEQAIGGTVLQTVCNSTSGGESTEIDLYTTLTPETTIGGVWTDTDGNPLASTIVDLASTGFNFDTTFIYTIMGDEPCVPLTLDATVRVVNCTCPSVDINPPGDLCNDSTLDLNSLKTPFTAPGTWNMNGPSIVTLVDDMVDLTTLVAGEYTIRYTLDPVPNGDCQLDSILSFNLSVLNTAVVTNTASVCVMESEFGSTVVDFTSLITDGFIEGEWQNTDNAPVDLSDWANVSFDGAPANTSYVFTYVIDNDEPCADQFYPVTVMTDPCDCPLITPLSPGVHCNSQGSLDLSQYNDPTYPNGSWSSSEVNVNDNIIDLMGLAAGDYTMIFTADGIPAECLADREVTISIIEFRTAELELDQSVCVSSETGSTILDFNSFILSGDTDGTWDDTDDSGVDLSDLSNVNFDGLTADVSYTFTYSIDNIDPCEDEVYMVEVMTILCDCDIIMPLNPGLHCNAEGTLDLTQYDDEDDAGTWSSDELTVTDNSVDLTGLVAGTYTLIYTLDVPDPNPDCPTSVTVQLIVASPLSAGEPDATLELCITSDTELVNLFDLILNEDPGGTWIEISGTTSQFGFDPVNGTFDIANNIAGTYTYKYMHDNEEPCSDDVVPIDIRLIDCDTLDCDITLYTDTIYTLSNVEVSMNLLENDILPQLYSTSINSTSEGISILSYDDYGDLVFKVTESFFEPLEIVYDVCSEDCDCILSTLVVINEDLQDIVNTNVISPNGDGVNDQLRFSNSELIPNSELWIYNRWGGRIFHMKNYDNSWSADGYPSGIYYYVLNVEGHILKKTLTIVR